MCVCVCVFTRTDHVALFMHKNSQIFEDLIHFTNLLVNLRIPCSLSSITASMNTVSFSNCMKSSCLHTSQKPTTTTCGYTSIIPIHIESDRRWSTYKHDLEQRVAAEALRPNQSREKAYHFCSEKMACCCS